jgi:transposase
VEVAMRGIDVHGEAAFAYVSCEARVPVDHPLRIIRAIVDDALEALSAEFNALYAVTGRPSVPPEKLLRALLLQAFYSVRSERQLMEQLGYNLLFRWFVGLAIDAPVWDVTVFTKNRERLLRGGVAATFMDSVLNLPRVQALLSQDHFTVDGTMVEAWASMKSFKRKPDEGAQPGLGGDAPPPADGGRNAEVDFHGEVRSNATHASTTDPEARLYRKGQGKEAKLCFLGHARMENRHGLFVDTRLTLATGTAERDAAGDMIGAMAGRHRITVGADKNYDTAAFVADLRSLNATPHVAQNTSNRRSAMDGRVTRHPGYVISQVIRKRIEEGFGWIKAVGLMAKTKLRGTARVGWRFQLTATAYDLIRLPRLLSPDTLQGVGSQKPLLSISNTCDVNPRFSAAC